MNLDGASVALGVIAGIAIAYGILRLLVHLDNRDD